MNAQTDQAKSAIESLANAFEAKMADKSLTIGIIGLGYVGLPLAQAYCRNGYNVMGFDLDDKKVTALKAGKSYIKHISDDGIAEMVDAGKFDATTDLDRLSEPDALLICVPTPLDDHRDPDLSYVEGSTFEIAKRLRKGQLVVLESTTYPGTSDELMKPILEKESGLKASEDFAIAYSPEREDPANPKFETSTIPKVVGADSPAELRMGVSLYTAIVPKVVPVSDMRTAEAVKVTENIFRAVNIALVNELKVIYGDMGIDVWEVIRAADTKPFGFMAFYPGPGLGGHCIPIDPFYLSWKARQYGHSARFIELSGEINANMPKIVINTVAEELSTRLTKSIKGSRILLLGLAYKKNVDDLRESPSLTLLEMLEERGALVDYYDPHIPETPHLREHPGIGGRKSIEWSTEALAGYDAALVATDHDDVDYGELLANVPMVIDTRDACLEFAEEFGDKIVKA